jgi:hypothetical protein
MKTALRPFDQRSGFPVFPLGLGALIRQKPLSQFDFF